MNTDTQTETDVLSMAQAELDQGRTCLDKYQDSYGASICFNAAYGLIETAKAKQAHADKLAEVLQEFLALDFAKATMSNIAPRIDKAVQALAAYKEAKQNES